jgi:hypothetical protein
MLGYDNAITYKKHNLHLSGIYILIVGYSKLNLKLRSPHLVFSQVHAKGQRSTTLPCFCERKIQNERIQDGDRNTATDLLTSVIQGL